MGLLEVARDTLKEIPMSDIVRERLSLALDRLSEAETKIETLQTEKGGMTSALDRERIDHQKTQQELQRLKDEHAEEIQIHRTGIEFRRGKRTSGKWMPFCPKCHLPATHPRNESANVICSDRACKWHVSVEHMMSQIINELPV